MNCWASQNPKKLQMSVVDQTKSLYFLDLVIKRIINDNFFAFQGLMKAIRWLGSQCYGSIYVNFGDLISVRDFLHPPIPKAELKLQTAHLATHVIMCHTKNIVLPLFSAVATVYISKVCINLIYAENFLRLIHYSYYNAFPFCADFERKHTNNIFRVVTMRTTFSNLTNSSKLGIWLLFNEPQP